MFAFIEARASYLWLSSAGGLTLMDFIQGHYQYGIMVLLLAYHYETMKPESYVGLGNGFISGDNYVRWENVSQAYSVKGKSRNLLANSRVFARLDYWTKGKPI